MEARNILIIGDQDGDNFIANMLRSAGYSYGLANQNIDLDHIIAKSKPDAIVADVAVNAVDSQAMIQDLTQQAVQIPVIMLVDEAEGVEDIALDQLKDGHHIKTSTRLALLDTLKQKLSGKNNNSKEVIAQDLYSKQVLSLAQRAAPSHVSVLISGESGVGKEVIARYIHDCSDRADKPFVAINCAAIPDTMLEASLFGYEKGAFTGANKSHEGKFEQAQGGTLLLDEISEMPLGLQAKLLRVLQEREVERLGSQNMISLDVRVIVTTNCNLQREVAEGNFRKDLYYRLNVFPIHWVPLRERPLDIIPMAEYLIKHHAQIINREVPSLSEGAKRLLIQYGWPGNAREMDNVIQRALIMQPGTHLEMADFLLDAGLQVVSQQPEVSNNDTETSGLKDQEHSLIISTLHRTKGNRTKAAELLSISPRTLRYKLARMREKGMDIPSPSRRYSAQKDQGET